MQPDFEGIEMREIRHKRLTRGAACALMKNKQRKGEWRMDRFDVAAEMIREAGEVLRRCRLEQTEIRQKTDHGISSPFGIEKSSGSFGVRS